MTTRARLTLLLAIAVLVLLALSGAQSWQPPTYRGLWW